MLLACAASRLGLLPGLLVSPPARVGGGRITAGSFLTALPGWVELAAVVGLGRQSGQDLPGPVLPVGGAVTQTR
ncbi:hypothetical protein ACWDOR_42260 [Streptosporangium canum]